MAKDEKLPSKSSRTQVDAFLRKVAATSSVQAPGELGRLIFAMDATASREPTWDRASHIQAEMFQETAALGGLEIQLVYYRGFGEFKASPWVSKSTRVQIRSRGAPASKWRGFRAGPSVLSIPARRNSSATCLPPSRSTPPVAAGP